jgi:hypothetical protein
VKPIKATIQLRPTSRTQKTNTRQVSLVLADPKFIPSRMQALIDAGIGKLLAAQIAIHLGRQI